MTDVPDAIRLALARRRQLDTPPRHPSTSPVPRIDRISRGDLRIVHPTAEERSTDARVCLVVGTDTTDEFADVVLAHTASELATSVDGVVSRVLSGAPYDIVVQTDLRGAVWTLQIGRCVGWVDEPVLEALSAIAVAEALDTGFTNTGVQAGIPLAGPTDRRWSFKEDEGAALRQLTANCTDAVLDGESVWEIDAQLLASDQHGEADDQISIVEELWEWTQTRKTRHVTLTDEALAQLLDPSSTGLERWSDVSDLGMDLSTSIWDLAADVSTSAPSTESADQSVRCLLTAEHLSRAGHASFGYVHYLGRREPVTS